MTMNLDLAERLGGGVTYSVTQAGQTKSLAAAAAKSGRSAQLGFMVNPLKDELGDFPALFQRGVAAELMELPIHDYDDLDEAFDPDFEYGYDY